MKKFSLVLITLLLLLITGSAAQADKYSSKDYKMMVSGTSTLHDWEAPASNLSAKGDITIHNSNLESIASLNVVCVAKSIKSEKESMDEKIYDALKAEDFPNINYSLVRVNSITKKGDEWVVETTGTLSIGGTSKTVDMTVKAKINADGNIVFNGSKKITLTSFNLERPSAMLGVIKCGDDITLTFSLTMKKA